ncbi:MAG: hypothetical protein AAB632_02205 [Patescibacteria group bacterium]|mgnify:CR=1 FL=1
MSTDTNTKKRAEELQICLVCGSKFAYPVERYQINDKEWRVLMLCPGCLCKRELTVDCETVRELLKNARIGREQVSKDLDEMQKKNMEEMADRFITALQKDHILPEDF